MALKIPGDSHHHRGCSRVFHVLAAKAGTLPEEVSGKGILPGWRWEMPMIAQRGCFQLGGVGAVEMFLEPGSP